METLFDDFGWKVTLETAPLPDGREKKAILVHHADSAMIIAFKEPSKILLLREFRPFYKDYIWMLPGGRVNKETDIETGARRELQEETGYDAKHLEYFCNANYSESLMSTNHFFIARDLFESPLPQDDSELMEVHELSPEEAIERVLHSSKVHMASAYALMRYLREKA